MDYHHHARFDGAWSSRQAAAKWVRRFKAEGMAGLADRNSRPQRLRQPVGPELAAHAAAMRRERWTGVRPPV
jgi:hypothetical protein